MTDQWVIVLGRNYASRLGMIRAAGEAGCKVAVIKTDKDKRTASRKEIVDASSRYVKKYYCARENDDEVIIRLLISEFKGMSPKAVLLPTDDYTASLIDLNIDRLKPYFLFPSVRCEQGKVVQLMDKAVQKQLAMEAGLNVARGWTAICRDGRYVIPDGVIYPCFIKPEVSFQGDKHFMQRCDDPAALREALDRLAGRLDCRVLIEEYMEIEQEYAVPGLVLDTQVMIPGIIEMDISHLGVTGTGIIRPWGPEEEGYKDLKTMLGRLGFTGLVDVDMFRSGGRIYFIELNMRFGASGYALTANGINLPQMLIECLAGDHPSAGGDSYSLGKSAFANEKVCLQKYVNGEMTWREFKHLLSLADHTFVFSRKDPLPGAAFTVQNDLRRGRKLLRRLLGRKQQKQV